MYYPCKPQLSQANLGGTEDFAVLGSRFKAAHVKVLHWWLAKKSREEADKRPTAIWVQKKVLLSYGFLGVRVCLLW